VAVLKHNRNIKSKLVISCVNGVFLSTYPFILYTPPLLMDFQEWCHAGIIGGWPFRGTWSHI